MVKITNEILVQLLLSMDVYKEVAQQLIDKLISETDQSEKEEIAKGNYHHIQNADLHNGQKHLSGDWSFDVHGEHCLFENVTTGQKLEVSLNGKESIGDLDPYFFYHFLETTKEFKHLTEFLGHPFKGTCDFFEDLERQKILTRVSGVQFRKL